MTIKSKASLNTDITTNINDNTTGDISPSDVRTRFVDILDSVHGVYGGLTTTGGVTTQNVNTTPAKILNWGATATGAGTTPSTVNNNIAVGTDGVYMIWYSLSFTTATANVAYTITPYKNTSAISGFSNKIEPDNTNVNHISGVAFASCVATDTITLYIVNDEAGGINFTMTDGQLIVFRVA